MKVSKIILLCLGFLFGIFTIFFGVSFCDYFDVHSGKRMDCIVVLGIPVYCVTYETLFSQLLEKENLQSDNPPKWVRDNSVALLHRYFPVHDGIGIISDANFFCVRLEIAEKYAEDEIGEDEKRQFILLQKKRTRNFLEARHGPPIYALFPDSEYPGAREAWLKKNDPSALPTY